MGFLDDLKQQASSLQNRQQVDMSSIERNTMLVEAACQSARQYLLELAQQFEVIRPVAKACYQFDNKTRFEDLPRSGFGFDARRKRLREQEVMEVMHFACTAKSAQQVALAKNFLNDIEKLDARIRCSGVPCETEPIKNHDNGKLIEMRYRFVADIRVFAKITPDHDRGTIHFSLHNMDALEAIECDLGAHELSQARLDELARWFVGQPNKFLDGAQGLRRTEPR